MDLDAEMEKLRREARAKLDAEREAGAGQGPRWVEPPEQPAERAEAASDLDAQAVDEARELAAHPEGSMSLGAKIATILVGLVAAWAALVFVVAPLLKIAFVLAIIAAVVWVILKLMDDDDDEDGAKKA